jgi:hypothetical protein
LPLSSVTHHGASLPLSSVTHHGVSLWTIGDNTVKDYVVVVVIIVIIVVIVVWIFRVLKIVVRRLTLMAK